MKTGSFHVSVRTVSAAMLAVLVSFWAHPAVSQVVFLANVGSMP